MIVNFFSEAEMQIAVAHSASEISKFLGFAGQKMIAIPREFRLVNQPVDCLFVAEDCRVVLVECKLFESKDLNGNVSDQVKRYVGELKKCRGLNLRSDLISYLDRYGIKWRQYLCDSLGQAAMHDAFWGRVEQNLKEGRIDIIIAADGFPSQVLDWLPELQRSLCPPATIAVMQVEKHQVADYLAPSFEFRPFGNCKNRSSMQMELWSPVRTRRWPLTSLPKRQARVNLVVPPANLVVDDSIIWARNRKSVENHVIDPARNASFIPVMPNVDLYTKSGSPYPACDRDRTVEPDPPDYRPWLAVGRVVWDRINNFGQYEHPRDSAVALATAYAQSALFNSHPLSRSHGPIGVQTALRDLHLFGLGCLFRKTGRRILFVGP